MTDSNSRFCSFQEPLSHGGAVRVIFIVSLEAISSKCKKLWDLGLGLEVVHTMSGLIFLLATDAVKSPGRAPLFCRGKTSTVKISSGSLGQWDSSSLLELKSTQRAPRSRR